MLYTFNCACGSQDLVRPLGTEAVLCTVCGSEALRQHVYHFDVVGPTVDTRGLYRRYSEASAEMGYREARHEANTGQPVQGPRLWQQSKRRFREMQRVGEAPAYRGKD